MENFEAKEKAFEMERDKAVEESKELSERVRSIDHEFKKQYDKTLNFPFFHLLCLASPAAHC